jgi:hypothetical protein
MSIVQTQAKPTSVQANATKNLVFVIKIFEARLNVSVSRIGTMNPCCRFRYGNQSFQTTVQTSADKCPRWNEIVTFEAS